MHYTDTYVVPRTLRRKNCELSGRETTEKSQTRKSKNVSCKTGDFFMMIRRIHNDPNSVLLAQSEQSEPQ